MRPIKFKGRVKYGDHYNKWVKGYLVETYDCEHGTSEISIVEYLASFGYGEADWNKVIAVDPVTVGQFTGHSDRIGEEIYEGDIVEYCSGCDSFGSVWQTVRIEYRAAEGGYVGVNQYRQTRDGRDIVQNIVRCLNKCKVVGNIHDKTDDQYETD